MSLFFFTALAAVAVAALYVGFPFERNIPIGPAQEITARCAPAVISAARSAPSFSSQHDRFRFVECRSTGRLRVLKSFAVGAVAWMLAAIGAVGWSRALAHWQIVVVKIGVFAWSAVASIAAVVLAFASVLNPYNDISRAYTTLFAAGFAIASLLGWLLLWLVRKKTS